MDFISQAVINLTEKTDSKKTINQIITSYGYPYERHFYETEDGYINMVARISGPKGTTVKENSAEGAPKRPVVILQHGLLDSCAGWILNGQNSLAYILADLGYDVWMNNSRGNRYSRHHIYLDADDEKQEERFWDYSFEELAKYDQPALFKFVLSRTGVQKVSYIGHSQGTTQMFCALSENLDFFRKHMNIFIALAPVVRVDSCSSGIIKKMKDNDFVENTLKKFKVYELFPSKGKNNKFTAFMHKMLPEIGNLGVKMLADDDPKTINQRQLDAYMAHFPAGSSLKSVRHFKQLMLKKQFEHFDYGREENLVRYGQETPPLIPIENVREFPIALLAGVEDHLAQINDVRWLKDLLQAQDSLAFYEEYKFGHLSFMLPTDLRIFQDVVTLVKGFNPDYQPAKTESAEVP